MTDYANSPASVGAKLEQYIFGGLDLANLGRLMRQFDAEGNFMAAQTYIDLFRRLHRACGKPLPLTDMGLAVAPQCNFRCAHCCIYKGDVPTYMEGKESELTTDRLLDMWDRSQVLVH